MIVSVDNSLHQMSIRTAALHKLIIVIGACWVVHVTVDTIAIIITMRNWLF